MNPLLARLPIATTLLAAVFAAVLFAHWQRRRQPHLAWWTFGVACFGAGTLMESVTALMGWNEVVFRLWYIFGALLGAAPLAQGTVYYLKPRDMANRYAAFMLLVALTATVCAWRSPLDPNVVNPALSAGMFDWQWVRFFSPVLNLFALWFLGGGAAWSAWQYKQKEGSRARFYGNCLIAIGAMLPGIGGAVARTGRLETLYITEFIGLSLIASGYWNIRRDPCDSISATQPTR